MPIRTIFWFRKLSFTSKRGVFKIFYLIIGWWKNFKASSGVKFGPNLSPQTKKILFSLHCPFKKMPCTLVGRLSFICSYVLDLLRARTLKLFSISAARQIRTIPRQAPAVVDVLSVVPALVALAFGHFLPFCNFYLWKDFSTKNFTL